MAHFFPVTVNAANGPSGANNRLTGWNFRETGGASAVTVNLRVGSVSGDIIESIRLAAGESVGNQYYRPINLGGSRVFVEVTGSGTATGTLHGD